MLPCAVCNTVAPLESNGDCRACIAAYAASTLNITGADWRNRLDELFDVTDLLKLGVRRAA